MRRFDRWIITGACLCTLWLLPVAGFGDEAEESKPYDCSKPQCSEWAPKGENTCRTCSIVQCKKENGGEVLVGEKKQSECYPGHGKPPKE
jgi:hypothetical protein